MAESEPSIEDNQPISNANYIDINLNELRKFDRVDLAHIFIAELRSAVLSERYIGVMIQEAGLLTEASLEDVQCILFKSALYSLITAAQGIKSCFYRCVKCFED